MTRRAATVLAVLAPGLALLLWLGAREDAPARQARRAATRAEPAAAGPMVGEAAPAPALPPSLAGTNEDGALVLDAAGRFVPTPDAIDLFDYYLSAQGEESDEQIRARILAAIRSRLAGEAAEAAEALLRDHLAYRARAAELLEGPLVGEDLERRLQYLRELRRAVFGAEVAEALFGEQEARWFADLERHRIARDDTLAPGEREAQLAATDERLPEPLRAARRATLAPSQLRRDEAGLRALGASEAEIAHLREQRFGSEAAERLARLDEERARWQARLAVYREARDAALAATAEADREAVLEDLRMQHFQPPERLRVRALDRAETGGPPP